MLQYAVAAATLLLFLQLLFYVIITERNARCADKTSETPPPDDNVENHPLMMEVERMRKEMEAMHRTYNQTRIR